jgi:hypothetical protein
MNRNTLTDETELLLTYLEERGLTELEATAVMGQAIAALLKDDATKRHFLQVLQKSMGIAPDA